ncbi:TolC family protein [Thiobacter sp. AK1]|uniref:TolC family protein n=1 Tax=Thiobacter aerophilum TaxID=3121275 RepID=A0ABV0EDG0_9BURK
MFLPDPFQKQRMLLAVLLACFSALGHALTFDEALRLAQTQASQLKAREENVAAARSNVLPAGDLPDPKLALGVDNLPVNGADAYSVTRDFMTMRRVGVMQEFPNAVKRAARVAVAQAKLAVAEAQTRSTRLAVLRETAVAWVARATVEQALAYIDALRRWIGAAADEALEGQPPDWPIARDVLAQRLHQHPELTEFDSKESLADAEIGEMQAEKKSDWSLELAYQQRGPQFSDMARCSSASICRFSPVRARTRRLPPSAPRVRPLQPNARPRCANTPPCWSPTWPNTSGWQTRSGASARCCYPWHGKRSSWPWRPGAAARAA